MPIFLIIPPIILLQLLNLAIKSFEPTTIEPKGKHRALLKQNMTESTPATKSLGYTFKKAQALNILAPSI
jgi:hypothetical protein